MIILNLRLESPWRRDLEAVTWVSLKTITQVTDAPFQYGPRVGGASLISVTFLGRKGRAIGTEEFLGSSFRFYRWLRRVVVLLFGCSSSVPCPPASSRSFCSSPFACPVLAMPPRAHCVCGWEEERVTRGELPPWQCICPPTSPGTADPPA